MKIGLLYPNQAISPTGGVKIQGEMWNEGFRLLGHDSELLCNWKSYDWSNYDALIMLGFGGSFRTTMNYLYIHNKKLAIAPIIDPQSPKWMHKFIVKYWGCHRFMGLTSRYHDLYLGSKFAQIFFTRSAQETEYLSSSCDIDRSRIFQIPLSVRFQPLKEMPQKESFCFHASRLEADNKNVSRLIEAAKKYSFKLVLAGYLHGKTGNKWLHDQIDGFDNIQYVGTVTDEELKDWYRRAKVFALPSLVEGVGMVALEAAGYGAEIVLTNVGAPKEYFKGRAELVNPRSVDEIGSAIQKCIQKEKSQPELMSFIDNQYSIMSCARKIVEALKTMK
jgi:glycosyltransferase involved in cell wall biosynthesis